MEDSDVRKYIAELLGTFALVFIGCGSAVIAGHNIGFLGISLAFGFTVLAMAYAIGPVSGCHINPAITIAMLVAGKIKGRDAVIYIIVQCLGAILASGALFMIATGLPSYNLSVNGLGQNGYGALSPMRYSMEAALVAEIVLTFLFLLVIFGATSKNAPAGFAGIPIGISLVFIHLVGIPITGTSVNPARSLGPALYVGGEALNQLWLFWVAPVFGAILCAVMWKYAFEDRPVAPKKSPRPKAPAPVDDDDEDDEVDEDTEKADEEDDRVGAGEEEDEIDDGEDEGSVEKAPARKPLPKTDKPPARK